jgi:rare lipoprotein A
MQHARCARRMALIAAAAASLAACATVDKAPAPKPTAGAGYKVGKPYQVGGVWYVPREQPDYDKVGMASWYGDAFHLKTTANGEIFDMHALTAAHTTLPLPSIVEVTNLSNGRKLRVRVNDRGPFAGNRIIDLSRESARQLGLERQGVARVRVRYVGPAPLLGRDAGVRTARARPPAAQPVQVARAAPPPPRRTPAPIYPDRRYDEQAAFTGAPVAPATPRQLQIVPAMPAAPRAVGPAYRIQAGAFSEEDRARRAAARLAGMGEAVVEPVERNGVTLYRVVLPGPQDELQAYNLRQRVADAGFGDARVTGPY